MEYIILRSIVCQIVQYLLFEDVLAVYVLDTTNDVNLFRRSEIGVGMKSKYFSTAVNETTVCFRFVNYKYLDHQYLFTLGSFFIGTSFTRYNSLFYYGNKIFYWPENEDIVTLLYIEVLDTQQGFRIIPYEIPEWSMNHWNSFCFTLSMARRKFSIIMNGRLLLEKHFHGVTLTVEDPMFTDMTIMAKRSGSKYRQSLFGKVADINIWRKKLNENEVSKWSFCSRYKNADIILDSLEKIEVADLVIKKIRKDKICDVNLLNIATPFLIPDIKLSFVNIVQYCRSLGSKVSVVNSRTKALAILSKMEDVKDQCGDTIYTGHILDTTQNSQISTQHLKFIDVIQNKPIVFEKWFPTEPNNYGGKEDCVELKKIKMRTSDSNWGMNDINCDDIKCPSCELEPFQQFHLRGACTNSQIDTVYYIIPNDQVQSEIVFMGYSLTKIIWNKSAKEWHITTLDSNVKVASSNDTATVPLGTKNWNFVQDICNNRIGNKRRALSLQINTGEDLFCCSDGMCISWSLKCDNVPNCSDTTDEIDCTPLVLPDGYDQMKPPPNKNTEWYSRNMDGQPNDVHVTFTVLDIYDINEKESTLTVRYKFDRSWRDSRLMFRDLSSEYTRNVIDVKKIWYPRFEEPSNIKNLITVEHHGVFAMKESNFTRYNEKHQILRAKIFDGADNPVIMSETQQVELFCNFKNLARYPFDEEECIITIAMNEPITNSIKLIARIEDKGPKMFSQYYIENWTITCEDKASKFMVTIKLHLHRNFYMILLVIYVPTLMVTIISQAMNYLSSKVGPEGNVGDFGNTIKVNTSCMIVLAMIYNSVSASLVSTPKVKMIEIWLLSSLVYAFTCILINIRLHLIQNAVLHQPGSNIHVNSISIVDISNSGKVDAEDRQISNNFENVFLNHLKEVACLKIVTFYVLPAAYTLFIILYFAAITNLYNV